MGLSIPAFLIAVQSTVRRRELGSATSTVQFSRTIGGAIGVSVMGVVLSLGLAQRLVAAGLDQRVIDQLISPEARGASVAVDSAARMALAGALQGVFIVGLVAALLALAVTLLTPAGLVQELVARRSAEEPPPGAASSVVGD
jgi:hypothetical protein